MNEQSAKNDSETPKKREKIDLFTVREFSEKSGIPYRGILAAIKSGDLRCLCRNKRWFRIRSEDGAKWIVSLTNRNYT